jgi:hypothetical protein
MRLAVFSPRSALSSSVQAGRGDFAWNAVGYMAMAIPSQTLVLNQSGSFNLISFESPLSDGVSDFSNESAVCRKIS